MSGQLDLIGDQVVQSEINKDILVQLHVLDEKMSNIEKTQLNNTRKLKIAKSNQGRLVQLAAVRHIMRWLDLKVLQVVSFFPPPLQACNRRQKFSRKFSLGCKSLQIMLVKVMIS